MIIGQPYRLQCPEHSYSSGCFYKWGKSTVYSGLSHIQEYNNRVLLEDGTLFFSTVQERDVREFNENGEGYMCILECAWSLNDHFTTLSHGILLDGSNGKRRKEQTVSHDFVILNFRFI